MQRRNMEYGLQKEGRKVEDNQAVSRKIYLTDFSVHHEDHVFDDVPCLLIKSLTLHSPSCSVEGNSFSFPNVILMPCKKADNTSSLLFMNILPLHSSPFSSDLLLQSQSQQHQ